MAKSVKVILSPDSTGEYKITYECGGFQGEECEMIAHAMAAAGTVTDKKLTDDAYTHHIPIPVPNQAIQ